MATALFQEEDESRIKSLAAYTRKAGKSNESDLEIVREGEVSDPKFGFEPNQRPLAELLKYGFIALDKPRGPTSHEVVAWVRRILGVERAGHSGTLDPMVSGVIPIGLNSATKALSALLLGPKEYIAVARIHDSVPRSVIDGVISEFVGPVFQKPPQRSSVKRATRSREIFETEVIEQKGNLLLIRVLCEAGTYIRKLVYDYGEIMKVGATMVELRRTRVCQILVSDLIRLHDLYEAKANYDETHDESGIRRVIRPVEDETTFLKEIRVRDSAVDAICHGAQLAVPGVVSFTRGISKGELVRILSGKGELVAFADSSMDGNEIKASEHGIVATTRRVIMESGTYPKQWKKHEKSDDTEDVAESLLKKSILDKLEAEQGEAEEHRRRQDEDGKKGGEQALAGS